MASLSTVITTTTSAHTTPQLPNCVTYPNGTYVGNCVQEFNRFVSPWQFNLSTLTFLAVAAGLAVVFGVTLWKLGKFGRFILKNGASGTYGVCDFGDGHGALAKLRDRGETYALKASNKVAGRVWSAGGIVTIPGMVSFALIN